VLDLLFKCCVSVVDLRETTLIQHLYNTYTTLIQQIETPKNGVITELTDKLYDF